ncbi:MAG: aldehyde ferredoxin oxidoreductase family protein [Methanosarcinaceae archaeon]|nr:aldehyde ferredoxin oxidoreductase family protein [Methanosarcinaceae archaeon]
MTDGGMIKGGYLGNILHIGLTEKKFWLEEVSEDFALKYIGGRGFGAKIVMDNLHEGMDPLGPENILVIAPGVLSGLYVPAAGKTSFVSISPLTGIYADSNMGGMFGVEIRQAGYDALVIHGRAPEFSYIWIDDDQVQIRDASKYRGKMSTSTERELKEDLQDEEIKVATIGPAGENLVRFACVNSEWSRNAGRTGMGAILGSKNIKAIAVRGTKDLPTYDLDKLVKISDRAYETLNGHPMMKFWQEEGLMSVIDYANTLGIIPTRNFSDAHFEYADRINGEVMTSRYKIGDSACYSCPMACGNICLVKSGKYAGTVTEGPEYESAAMLGSNVGINDFSAVLRGNYLCDELGMDTISSGSLVATVIEGYERGLLSLEDVDGIALSWGDDSSIMMLLEKIANREGIGDVLAEGAKGVIEKFPHLEPLISHVKGMDQSAYDGRVGVTMALAYSTSDIGAHHARAWTIAKELEVGANWTLEEKIDLVIYHQTVRPLFDMLGVCRLPWIELGFDENTYAEFYTAATGVEVTLDDLLEKSKNIYNLTRAINMRMGVTRTDDHPPERTFNDPIKTGPHAGEHMDRNLFEQLLEIYYQRRGWDKDGRPSEEQLHECGVL